MRCICANLEVLGLRKEQKREEEGTRQSKRLSTRSLQSLSLGLQRPAMLRRMSACIARTVLPFLKLCGDTASSVASHHSERSVSSADLVAAAVAGCAADLLASLAAPCCGLPAAVSLTLTSKGDLMDMVRGGDRREERGSNERRRKSVLASLDSRSDLSRTGTRGDKRREIAQNVSE